MSIDLSLNTFQFPKERIPDHFKAAAVLIALCFRDDAMQIVLTKRASNLRAHPGEVSFPGGKLEPGETNLEAAIREAEEEIGLVITPEQVIGQLDDAWSRGGYHITSYVAVLDEIPPFTMNEEVDRIVIFDDSAEFKVDYIPRDMKTYTYQDPVIYYGGDKIIGATADLILELMDALQGDYQDRGAMRLRLLQSVHG